MLFLHFYRRNKPTRSNKVFIRIRDSNKSGVYIHYYICITALQLPIPNNLREMRFFDFIG